MRNIKELTEYLMYAYAHKLRYLNCRSLLETKIFETEVVTRINVKALDKGGDNNVHF